MCVGARGYRPRRKGYERLGGSPTRFKRAGRVEAGLALRQRSGKTSRKPIAKGFFLWLRDSYVRMMLVLAEMQLAGSYDGFEGPNIGGVFERAPPKEYDKQVLMEIFGQVRTTLGSKRVNREAGQWVRAKRIASLLSELKEEADEDFVDDLNVIGKIEEPGEKRHKSILDTNFRTGRVTSVDRCLKIRDGARSEA
ncbi:hypothetical protein CDL15_Pgr010062 [Punica granatum]|nr:hypothetical protein CDL15_Pgr010062 [Punica granatum]PKI73936.1 hypothetical protein CRG98_005661 [Punica granatum]